MAITDYKRIEYIEGASGAYIDLGVTGNRAYSYYAECTIPTDIGARATIWGAEGSANKYNFGILADGTAYRIRYAASSPTLSPVASSAIANPRRVNITMETATSGGNIYMYDYNTEELLANTSYSYGGSNTNLNRNLYLLALNASSSGTPSYPGINCRIYWFEVYNATTSPTTVLRQMAPIRDPATGNVGMYDLKNDVAYWSGGTNFIAGPDIGSASKLWIRQSGSWTSGTPYIKQSGSWNAGKPYIKQSGSWNQGS